MIPERLEQYLDKKYILKSGRMLYHNHEHFNNNTLTDKIAAAAIKKNPALEGRFINERERKVLEAKVEGHHAVVDAQASVNDEAVEKVVEALIEAGEFADAEAELEKLSVEETKEKLLKEIAKAEKAVVDENATKKKAENTAKKKADEDKGDTGDK